MLLELLILLVSGFLALWFYGKWRHSYWRRLGVKTPPFQPIVGHFLRTFSSTTPVWEWRNEAYHKHGGKLFCGLYNFFTPQMLIGDPDLIKNILIRDFDHFVDRRHLKVEGPENQLFTDMLNNASGERWRRIRAAVTPAFTSGRLKTMFPLILEKAKILQQVSQNLANKSETVEIKKFLGRFSMDATASCGFGIESNSLLNKDDEFSKKAAVIFNPTTKRILQLISFYVAPRFCRAFGMKVASPGLQHYADIVTEVLKLREETGISRGDFIDLMIEARKIPDELSRAGKKHALEDITVVSQAVVFLLSGYDNIATTLSFCCYHLAHNPELQEEARKEIDDLKEQHGNEITYDGIMEAKYLDACISESLRLYPTETSFNRLCVKDYKLGDTGLVIPKDMVVEVPVWSLHRDPEKWLNPDEFQPERFINDKKNEVKPYTYLPFGAGPRNCIGQRFTMMITKTALAYLLQGVRMSVHPSQPHPPELACSPIILRPKNGIRLVFESLHELEE